MCGKVISSAAQASGGEQSQFSSAIRQYLHVKELPAYLDFISQVSMFMLNI